MSLLWLAGALFMFGEPICRLLSDQLLSNSTTQESALLSKQGDRPFQIDHILRRAPIVLNTIDDRKWQFSACAIGTVALEKSRLVLRLNKLALFDPSKCTAQHGSCPKVLNLQVALAREEDICFTIIARSETITLNTVLPPSGYKAENIVLTLQNDHDVTAAQLANSLPISIVAAQWDGNGVPTLIVA